MSAPTDEQSPPAPPPPAPGEGVRRPWIVERAPVLAAAMLAVALVLGVAVVGLHQRAGVAPAADGTTTPVRATGIPDSVSTSTAYLMGLSPVPSTAAPGFTLRDQSGRVVSLASLLGHPVVLEFMDPSCVDICPIVSQEFVDASRDLGPAGSDVVFLGVNVNPFHTDVASVAAYSRAHGLSALSGWHFLTGTPTALRQVWKDYSVAVSAPSPSADVVHTSVVYFLDRSGRERYVAFPMAEHAADGSSYLPADQTAAWGRGIAEVARSLR